MIKNSILEIKIDNLSESDILEKIKKFLHNPSDIFHIVSLNPENFVIAQDDSEFKRVLETAQLRIVDGIGVILAARMLGITLEHRVTGVQLMKSLLKLANTMRLRVLLIGGRQNLALRLAKCYQQDYPEAKFFGTIGFLDIKNPQKEEEIKLFAIVRQHKPHIVLVAFGSPEQELWIDRHSNQLKETVVMGVGGAFDYFGGVVTMPPVFLQKIGLEWLFRLIFQPWRWKRQLRLLKFSWLILNEWKKRF